MTTPEFVLALRELSEVGWFGLGELGELDQCVSVCAQHLERVREI